VNAKGFKGYYNVEFRGVFYVFTVVFRKSPV